MKFSIENFGSHMKNNNMEKKMPVLPVSAYTSQEWFDKEIELIFSKTWQFAGFEEDVKNPGDHINVQAGNNNIVIIRNEEGDLNAFHNICRHRGAQLLRTAGKTKNVITCPYHDWTYRMDGSCSGIPDHKTEFPDVDKKDKGLFRAKVAVWKTMMFVHPDENAENLMEWLKDADEFTGPHQPEKLSEYENTMQSHEFNANWKIVAENFIDVYHLSHLHSATLNMYDHKKQQSAFHGNHFYFYEPLSEEYSDGLENKAPYPLINHIPEDEQGAYTPLFFPNLGLGEDESSWSTFHIIPISPEKTRVEIRSKLMPSRTGRSFSRQEKKSAKYWNTNLNGKYGEFNDDDPMASADFIKEDIYACEQLQKSLKSPYFQVQETAVNLEKSVRDFQGIVLDFMNKKINK